MLETDNMENIGKKIWTREEKHILLEQHDKRKLILKGKVNSTITTAKQRKKMEEITENQCLRFQQHQK